MAGQKFTLTLDANLNISQVKQAISNFQSSLDSLKLPAGILTPVAKDLAKLQNELKNFEALSSKNQFDKTGANALASSYEKISTLISKLNIDVKGMQNLDLSKLLPPESLARFEKLSGLLTQIASVEGLKSNLDAQMKDLSADAENLTKKIEDLKSHLQSLQNTQTTNVSNKTAAESERKSLETQINSLKKAQAGLEKAGQNVPNKLNKVNKELTDAVAKANTLESKINNLSTQIQRGVTKGQSSEIDLNNTDTQNNRIAQLEQARIAYENLIAKIRELRQEQAQLQEQPVDVKQTQEYQDLQTQINQLNQQLQKVIQSEEQYKAAIADTGKNITRTSNEITKYENDLAKVKQKLTELTSADIDGTKLQSIRQALAEITQQDISKIPTDLNQLKKTIDSLHANQLEEVEQKLEELARAAHEAGEGAEGLGGKVKGFGDDIADMDSRMGEVDMLKRRIQYFFGLDNAVQLVKRTMRDAYQTVKDLDKAMTETAVVTDFSVGDMWAQLPEYTRRANELGVTTQAAYEAATLYYQQGLNTNEVMAMANETLKMARIAGLDAAEATDRMTNAIRGFNMEINTMNAQRIDDVYSRLAAISASNVDEISTAMTKVASLAHNANMEFETTAAFLAQIIETTRESAETAGTALKTVVARFSEVKKLVDENQLRGTDEEGQEINVNKVSEALRTAGIDLNKYFLGEVGLDDIFMELASKWDSLTTLQQRYIATQAAGSRQQSRFIALMSDYARTQELVGEAYKANGASAKQFEKTQESLESKLAKLKNAWNEFAMGILNSDLIKIGVDTLTNILKFVNNLTSGFGTLKTGVGGVINSLSKLLLLLGLLNVGKGLAAGLTGSIAGTFGGGAAGGAAALGFKGMAAKAMFGTAQAGAMSNMGILPMLGKGFLNPMAGMGKGIGSLFKVGGTAAAAGGHGAGAIAGLGGLMGPILGILAALAVISILWYNFSPEGKLKKAQKAAEKAAKALEKANQKSKSFSSFQEDYDAQTEKVNSASTAEERKSAIEERNEAILAAIKENPDLAQFVKSDMVDGVLTLTVDAKGVQEAAIEAAREATLAAMNSYYADANTTFGKINTLEKKLDTLREGLHLSEEAFKKWMLQDSPNPSQQSALETSVEISQLRSSLQPQLEMAFQSALSWIGKYNDTDANLFSSTLSKLYSEGLIKSSVFSTQEKLNTGRIQTLADDFFSNTNTNFKPILSFLSGEAFDNVDLSGADIDKADIGTIGQLFGFSIDELEEFGQTLGLTSTELTKLYDFIKDQAKLAQTAQKEYRKTLKSTYYIPDKARDNASIGYLKSVEPILEKAKPLLNIEQREGLFDYLYGEDGTTERSDKERTELLNFISSIDLSSPISAFSNLKTAIKTSTGYVKELAESLYDSNTQLSNTGYMVQAFFMSDSYDQILDDVQKIIETNGELGAADIEALAGQSKELDILLKNNIVNANGLAKAITLVAKGKIGFEDLNTRIIQTFEKTTSLKTILTDIQYVIQNFDAGIDAGEGLDFLSNKITELQELINNFEFGNDRTKNLYELFFGKGSYDEAWEQGEDVIRQNVQTMSKWLQNDGYGFFNDKDIAGALGITNLGNGILKWDLSDYKSYDELIKHVQEVGGGLSEEAAKMFIAGFKSHGEKDTADRLAELEREDLFRSIVTGDFIKTDFGDNKARLLLSENEIKAYAAQLGLEEDQFLKQFYDYIKNNSFTTTDGKTIEGAGVLEEWYRNNIKNILSNPENDSFITNETKDQIRALDNDVKTQLQDLFLQGFGDGPLNIEAINDLITTKGIDSSIIQVLVDKYNHYLNNMGQEGGLLTYNGQLISFDETDTDADIAETLSDKITEGIEKGVAASEIVLGNIQTDKLADTLKTAVKNAIEAGATSATLPSISAEPTPSATGKGFSITFSFGSKAAGGNILGSMTSLTGEEGSEIVWNKEKGYSYIAGANGPEFNQLNPGDRVFNAEETKKILRNSKHSPSKFLSNADPTNKYGTGKWNLNGSGSGGGGGSSEDKAKEDKWKNEIDWLYNLVEDIAELERIQTKLQEEYDDYLEDQTKNGRDLYNLLIKQLGNLYTQLDHQTYALEQREREMHEFMDTTNQYDQYLSYNWTDRTLEIDWDGIEAIQDKDTYNEIKDLISQAESIQDKMDSAEDKVQDIRNQIEDLENIWRETYTDFEERVLDALVQSYQEIIDNYNELNDTLSDSNSQILNALQKQISLERQIRDNTKTEEDIADQEARLAFLRRDTTGGNELSALELSSQLDESRQSYEDNLIDQAISKLQEDNNEAAQQRQKQIEIMQAQLDYQQQSGEFNAAVRELLESAMGGEGQLLTDSELMKLLKEQENWAAMSDVSKSVWEEELNGTFKEVAAFILKQNAQENGTYITALTAAIGSISSTIGSYSQALTKISNGSGGSSGKYGGGSSQQTEDNKPSEYRLVDNTGHTIVQGSYSLASAQAKWYGFDTTHIKKVTKFATGGLSTKTGPAWLDGTPSEPEYVLNARQTDAFLKLADVLPAFMSNGSTSTTTFGGINLNLVMNVDQIASDYDVDRIADRVKSIIYDAGSYRNVNTLNFSR